MRNPYCFKSKDGTLWIECTLLSNNHWLVEFYCSYSEIVPINAFCIR